MSETEKALRAMRERLEALSRQTPQERFEHLIKQGVIDRNGSPTGIQRPSSTEPPSDR
jgi:hypothetical protein